MAAILLAVIFIGPRLISFFMPLIIAWILATIVNPIVVFLENKIKIMRKHGSAIVIVQCQHYQNKYVYNGTCKIAHSRYRISFIV